jgi:hypothetical protein
MTTPTLYAPTEAEAAAVSLLNVKGRHTFADTAYELGETFREVFAEAATPPTRYTLETLVDVNHLRRELYRHALRAVRVYDDAPHSVGGKLSDWVRA